MHSVVLSPHCPVCWRDGIVRDVNAQDMPAKYLVRNDNIDHAFTLIFVHDGITEAAHATTFSIQRIPRQFLRSRRNLRRYS